MKKSILSLSVVILLIGSFSTAFGQKTTKKTIEANQDSIEDIQKFKKKSNEQIADNREKIAKLKTRKTKESAEDNAKYEKKILALEEKNNSLKKRIDECNEKDKTNWASFKREFNHDMDELGSAIKDIGVDNMK